MLSGVSSPYNDAILPVSSIESNLCFVLRSLVAGSTVGLAVVDRKAVATEYEEAVMKERREAAAPAPDILLHRAHWKLERNKRLVVGVMCVMEER